MAKDATETQQRMPGTYDEPIPELQEKAAEYDLTLRRRMTTQTVENRLREELIQLMKDHGRDSCELDGAIVTLEHTEKDKIKVKTKSEDD